MNRSRIAFAVVTLAAILFMSLSPAAEARSLRSKPAVSESGSWLDATLVWLGSLLTGREDSTRTAEKQLLPVDGGGIIAYTGVCIDPDGNRVPCPRPIL